MAATAISAVLTEPPPLMSFNSVDSMSRDYDVQSPSSLGDDSTLDTELSVSSEISPEPDSKNISTSIDIKSNTRSKAASLSLEEQVSHRITMRLGPVALLMTQRSPFLEQQITGGP